MRIEFRQGVPPECIDWLWDNVGSGNISPKTDDGSRHDDLVAHDWHLWKYERIGIAKPITAQTFDDEPFEYVPTIEIKDSKMALLFTLKWSS